MNGRVYDPIIGRFVSADPNIFHPFDSQNYNRYSYVMNNPLIYVDPSGYDVDFAGTDVCGEVGSGYGMDEDSDESEGEGNSWYDDSVAWAKEDYIKNVNNIFGEDVAKRALIALAADILDMDFHEFMEKKRKYNKRIQKLNYKKVLEKAFKTNRVVGVPLLAVPLIPETIALLTTWGIIKMSKNEIESLKVNMSIEMNYDEVGIINSGSYTPAPSNITDLFPDAIPVKSKNQRKRWSNKKTGEIYERDYQHGDIEIYDKRGKHKGSINPETRKEKAAVKGRRTNN